MFVSSRQIARRYGFPIEFYFVLRNFAFYDFGIVKMCDW